MTRPTTWHHTTVDTVDPPEDVEGTVVIGAGAVGLLTARELANAGETVHVLEAHTQVATRASGRNTGKVMAWHGRQLGQITRVAGREAAADYFQRQVRAFEQVISIADELGVPHTRCRGGLWAHTDDGLKTLQDEADLARELGVPLEIGDAEGLPPGSRQALNDHTTALDPAELMTRLGQHLTEQGATLSTGARVRRIRRAGGRVALTLTGGRRLTAHRVVVATGSPILDRGAYFTRVRAERSYIVPMFGAAKELPLLFGCDDPMLSLRPFTSGATSGVLVGGGAHGPGRVADTRDVERDLATHARRLFPDLEPGPAWSAQDYLTADHLPIVETAPTFGGSVVVVTGMNKWGMTVAHDVAERIRDHVTGRRQLPSTQSVLAEAALSPQLLAGLGGFNGEVALAGAAALPRWASRRADAVGVCGHLGGPLLPNDVEGSLDCALHGSRFERDGAIVEGCTRRPAITRVRGEHL